MSELTLQLWQRYREHGDLAARRELIDRYIGLVHHAARQMVRHVGRDVTLDDLLGAGTMGLIQALEGFDPGRGLKFTTYSVPRIRGSMLDELRRHDGRPRSVRTRERRIAQARATLQQRLGHGPSAEQIAVELGIEPEVLFRWQREGESRRHVTLDEVATGDEGEIAPLHDVLADEHAPDPEREAERDQTLAALRAAIAALPERDQLVLALYYVEELSLREIGVILHVTESRVSQLHSRALKRLRAQLAPETEEAA